MSVRVIVRNSGRQFNVAEGDVFDVNRLPGKVGGEVSLKEVLCVDSGSDVRVGQPLIEGASVECEIVDHPRGDKVHTFKIKRRKNYRRKMGHRQDLTRLKVKSIKT